MNKKTFILFAGILVILGLGTKILFFSNKGSEASPSTTQILKQKPEVSNTLKSYSDPSGFSFNYPDNLSILPNDLKDANSYADLQLVSKDIEGSLHLKITDSKLKTLDEWVEKTGSKNAPKEVMLGNLKAVELEVGDKIELAALDLGILFNIQVDKSSYFQKVYEKVLADFTFIQPTQASTSEGIRGEDDISFEGEEVVE